MIEFMSQPWPWYVSGPILGFIMLILLFFGESFGVSSNLRILCSMCGAKKYADFFHFDWKEQIWNVVLIAGAVLGGYIAHTYLTTKEGVLISESSIRSLEAMGLEEVGVRYVPDELFGQAAITSWSGLTYLIIGGLLVGFGSRYAGGCTSGHAISGLSNLQLPSLMAVVGFFIGGLITTFFVLPMIL